MTHNAGSEIKLRETKICMNCVVILTKNEQAMTITFVRSRGLHYSLNIIIVKNNLYCESTRAHAAIFDVRCFTVIILFGTGAPQDKVSIYKFLCESLAVFCTIQYIDF